MSSKIILLFSIFILSCGVKTRPKAPANTKLPSLQKKYSYKVTPVENKEEQKKEEKKNKTEAIKK